LQFGELAGRGLDVDLLLGAVDLGGDALDAAAQLIDLGLQEDAVALLVLQPL
jgi:hypothetical protein